MSRTTKRSLFIVGIVTAALLGTAPAAHAWGAAHVGYTHVGPGGVQHYGATAMAGPRGEAGGAHYSAYGAGGAYHAGYGGAEGYRGGTAYGGYRSYQPSGGGGYAVGGYRAAPGGAYGAYGAGVYRGY